MELNDRTIVVNEEDLKAPEQQTPTEAPIETPPETPIEAPTETTGYDWSPLNEKYKEVLGDNPLDEGSFTDLLKNRSKLTEYESQLQAKEADLQSAMEYKTKWETALETLNPEKLTPNKEILAISELSEKHKGVDIGTISKVRNTDLESMDHLDGLVLAAKLNTKTSLPDSAIKGEILRGLGIDVDSLDELTDVEKFRIESEFSSKKGILEDIKAYQPETADFNLEAEITAYKEKQTEARAGLEAYNKQALNTLFDSYKETKTVIKDDQGQDVELSYVVDQSFKEKFFDDALKNITDSGVKITTENAGSIAYQIDQAFKTENFNNIVQDAVKQMLSKKSEAVHNELNNDSPTNTTEAPPISSKETLPLNETLGSYMKKNK